MLIGVSETVFANHSIEITTASAPTAPAPTAPAPTAFVLSTAAIVGIAIGGVVVLALASGCAYMQIRKRRNRADRSRRTLSFRCKAAATEEAYRDEDDADDRFFANKDKRRNIQVCTAIACPEPAFASPRLQGGDEDWTPPTSTVSTRSGAPLLASPALRSNPFIAGASQRHVPGSPVHVSRIQTSFDPPPTR
jgi:hypothetical protein